MSELTVTHRSAEPVESSVAPNVFGVDAAQGAASSSTPDGPRISVIVPTYNEAANLPHVFALMPEVHEVIVVDGRSTDGTIETAKALRPDVKIVLQNRRGKGNAMACGFAAATGDILVMLDADGSADPREIPRFVEALQAGAHFAKGTRFALGGGSNDITALRRAGNWALNTAANVLFGTRYTDLCYGYNAFWTHCLEFLELDATDRGHSERSWGDGFEIETLINTRIAKAKLDIREVASFEFERIHGESNLNTFRDGFRVLTALVVERVRPAAAAVIAPVVPVAATTPATTTEADVVIDLTALELRADAVRTAS